MIHFQDEKVTLHHGDCLDVLRELPDCSVDSVCTDPPYGLGFMGKEWDSPRMLGAMTEPTGFVDLDHWATDEDDWDTSPDAYGTADMPQEEA